MGILQSDLQFVSVLFQRVQEVFRKAAWKQSRRRMSCYSGGGRGLSR